MKKILNLLCHRSVIVGVSIVIQALVLVGMLLRFMNYFVYFYAVCLLASLIAVIYLVNNRSNPAYKIIWIILIQAMPIFGGLFYLMFGGNRLTIRQRRRLREVEERLRRNWNPDEEVIARLEKENPGAAGQSRYLQQYALCSPYQNTSVEYLSLGEKKWERMLEELKKAEHFIFMEYFIIQEGKMWDPILEILAQKARDGVDVRLIYDDVGCLMTLPKDYAKRMEALGIKCCVFNPFVPRLNVKMNNRDHRKICVIDGHTGFTGGINLADEYINAYPKHGHWKDAAVMLKGNGVWNLTAMFLSVWDYIRPQAEDWDAYRPGVYQREPVPSDGYVQPYGDSPQDGETVGENVYLNLISKAQRYVYICTPYLIVDNEMVTALSNAAKCGVDVRILTPHHADKWYVHAVTRAYYQCLLEAGVKIYEYTPGFVHAKSFVADDQYATVGTINLDYRSLYLHFECGCWMYQCSCIADMKQDYLDTLAVSQAVTLEECRAVPWYRKVGRSLLRLVAPLM